MNQLSKANNRDHCALAGDHLVVKIIAGEIPRLQPLGRFALSLCPFTRISERVPMPEGKEGQQEDDQGDLDAYLRFDGGRGKVKDDAEGEDREIKCREIVV
jgi:hypothetical protein